MLSVGSRPTSRATREADPGAGRPSCRSSSSSRRVAVQEITPRVIARKRIGGFCADTHLTGVGRFPNLAGGKVCLHARDHSPAADVHNHAQTQPGRTTGPACEQCVTPPPIAHRGAGITAPTWTRRSPEIGVERPARGRLEPLAGEWPGVPWAVCPEGRNTRGGRCRSDVRSR
jgi:hypothetical protein